MYIFSVFLLFIIILGIIIYPYLPIYLDKSTNTKNYTLEKVFTNLKFESLTDFQISPDQTNRIFVVERSGKIITFQNSLSVKTSSVFLDISPKIVVSGEMGLLGLVFDPNYKTNGYFYVDYTTETNNQRSTYISRFQVDPTNPNKALTNSELIILQVSQPYSNHNAGQIIFGPDGYLYVTLGDGGGANDPSSNGQNLKTLLGSILRIDVNNPQNGKNYGIPLDNPFVNNSNGYLEEIYAYGFRNPYRLSYDKNSNLFFIGDVGQNKYEEVDILQKGGNYGWNIKEGYHCFITSQCDSNGLIDPIFEYNHSLGIAIIGGYVYRSSELSNLSGTYIFGDYVSGRIWSLDFQNGNKVNEILKINITITSFGIDNTGNVYILDINGNIYQIIRS